MSIPRQDRSEFVQFQPSTLPEATAGGRALAIALTDDQAIELAAGLSSWQVSGPLRKAAHEIHDGINTIGPKPDCSRAHLSASCGLLLDPTPQRLTNR